MLDIPCDPALKCTPEVKATPKEPEPEPKKDQPDACACSNGLNADAEQVPFEERLQAYVNSDDRTRLVKCITELRARVIENLRKDKPVSECADELSELEGIATADAVRLSTERTRITDALKSLTADDETLTDRLDDVKDSLRELEPVVSVTGTTATQTANVYTEARAAALESKNNDKAAKACVDRWAYVNIDISKSHEGLLNCVKQLQAAIRKPTREETIVAESQFNLPLARMEQRLRGFARAKATKYKQLDAEHEAAVGTKKQELDDEMSAIKKQLDEIRQVVLIPDESMYAEYAEYEQYFNKFFLGYEYVSLDDAFGKGFLRVGIMTG
ncbi:MAG TPA: hypothetical protein VM733_04010, partial [Thermoanaerobaculia bacterium]|nr:hypothetical protein [Thermoanaerobaculia bacterium]